MTCTFFIIPVDAKGEPAPKQTPATPSPSEPVKALPNTGAGLASGKTSRDGVLVLAVALGVAAVMFNVLTMARQRRS